MHLIFYLSILLTIYDNTMGVTAWGPGADPGAGGGDFLNPTELPFVDDLPFGTQKSCWALIRSHVSPRALAKWSSTELAVGAESCCAFIRVHVAPSDLAK